MKLTKEQAQYFLDRLEKRSSNPNEVRDYARAMLKELPPTDKPYASYDAARAGRQAYIDNVKDKTIGHAALGGTAGALIGSIYGALSPTLNSGEDKSLKRRLRNALLGVAIGAPMGAGISGSFHGGRAALNPSDSDYRLPVHGIKVPYDPSSPPKIQKQSSDESNTEDMRNALVNYFTQRTDSIKDIAKDRNNKEIGYEIYDSQGNNPVLYSKPRRPLLKMLGGGALGAGVGLGLASLRGLQDGVDGLPRSSDDRRALAMLGLGVGGGVGALSGLGMHKEDKDNYRLQREFHVQQHPDAPFTTVRDVGMRPKKLLKSFERASKDNKYRELLAEAQARGNEETLMNRLAWASGLYPNG